MKKSYYIGIAIAAAVVLSVRAEVPEGYYNSLEGKYGVALKKAVKEVAGKHDVVDYGEDTWTVFETSDTREVQGEPIWWDMYSSQRVKVAYGHDALNIEHSVANSWWNGEKNDAYKDLFHLNPANAEANNAKSNYPLGEISSQTWGNGVTFVGVPKSGLGGGASRVYEPVDHYKGDFARAFFYIFTVYDDINWRSETSWMYDTSSELLLKPWATEMLLRWAAEDPVSVKEYNRNEAIYAVQHNRNPYIDCSNLAGHIWGDDNTKGFTYLGAYEPAPDPDLGDDDEGEGPTLKGHWVAVTGADEIDVEHEYCILETGSLHAMSYSYEKGHFKASEIIPDVDKSGAKWTISAMPEDMAVVTFEPVAGGFAIGISSPEGDFLGYMKSTTDKNVSLSANYNADGCTVAVTPDYDNNATVFDFGAAGKLYYNVRSPRFTTYAKSTQQALLLFRKLGDDEFGTGVGNIGEENFLNTIVRIYDINGRLVNASDIDELDSGLYIIITPASPVKFLK